jgi:hypothetical protein
MKDFETEIFESVYPSAPSHVGVRNSSQPL